MPCHAMPAVVHVLYLARLHYRLDTIDTISPVAAALLPPCPVLSYPIPSTHPVVPSILPSCRVQSSHTHAHALLLSPPTPTHAPRIPCPVLPSSSTYIPCHHYYYTLTVTSPYPTLPYLTTPVTNSRKPAVSPRSLASITSRQPSSVCPARQSIDWSLLRAHH